MSTKGSGPIQLLTAYKLIRNITKPWEDWEAYKLGLIDDKGKKIRVSKTREEQNAFPIMTVLAANIKRLVQKLPGGGTKFASLAAALFLLKEQCDLTDENIEYICEELNIDINPDEIDTDFMTEDSLIVNNSLVRHIEETGENFFGYQILEGKDIVSGSTIRFLGE